MPTEEAGDSAVKKNLADSIRTEGSVVQSTTGPQICCCLVVVLGAEAEWISRIISNKDTIYWLIT